MNNKKITIGILAGMGPRSTAPFIDMVIDECQKQYGAKNDEDFPSMIICSLPTPFFVDQPIDHKKMKQVLIEGLKRLEATDVNFIAIPCNAVHRYFDDLQKNIKVPLLNMVDETIKRMSQTDSVVIVGTENTIESEVYQKALTGAGINYTLVPEQTKVNELIKSVKTNTVQTLLSHEWSRLVQTFKRLGANKILLACTDLNVIVQTKDMEIIDATQILAEEVVKKYLKLNK